ncbi:efflux RND transporter permease subunit [Halosolutus gelatinilyticus]|uniref:efflux RND transporter permease subunit n=1 Tax=Halosolutus gelatinilyticus TaxID=2931975 RepID=UPI001FF2FDB6|nr:MMPL family transporter [Halosolutus gelatinilyticus]
MEWTDRFSAAITAHSRVVIAILLAFTLVIGTGAGFVEQDSSLDQYYSDTDAAEAHEYVADNFSAGSENTTYVQVVVRGENVLSKESLIQTIRLQQSFQADREINDTLADSQQPIGIANVVATRGVVAEQRSEVETAANEFEELNRTVRLRAETLQQDRTAVNETQQLLRTRLEALDENRSASPEDAFDDVRANSELDLNESDYRTFADAVRLLRAAETDSEAETAYEMGTRGVLAEEYADFERRSAELRAAQDRLETLGEDLRAGRNSLESAASPTLEEQAKQLESMNQSAIDRLLERVLDPNASDSTEALALMPVDYDPGSTTANATMVIIAQETGEDVILDPDTAPPEIIDSQLAMQSIAEEFSDSHDVDAFVFGIGAMGGEINRSMADSLKITGPFALVLVLATLILAYRDLLDILLGLAGLGVVFVWMFGAMGWLGIDFNQIFIAVPVLLIGLAIDFALHVIMRYRERRQHSGGSVRDSMAVSLADVSLALVWVTATTAIGFLMNFLSPVAPIRDFAVISAIGIASAFVVFTVLLPALKIEIDGALEARGYDREKRAFGTDGGRFSRILSLGSNVAHKSPAIVIALVLLVSAGGLYGAAQVEAEFAREDFLAADSPEWMDHLPEALEPHEYSMQQNLAYLNDHFSRQDSQAYILLRGNVTDPDALQRLDRAETKAAESPITQRLSTGEARTQSPTGVMQRVAAENESFEATLGAADTDGDGDPDRNVRQVYDELFDTAPDSAAAVIHRTDDGEYRALRMTVVTAGDVTHSEVTDEMRAVAAVADGETTRATATGDPILFEIVSSEIHDTFVTTLTVALVVIAALLVVGYRLMSGSAVLGVVTMLPVVFVLIWILGTMALLDISFNPLTGMITSLTIGLGIDYSIHLSERYTQELNDGHAPETAMNTAVTGTGGALLGSAATTAGVFGVLAFAFQPGLQQFGLVTALTIVYSFFAAVYVLPSLLAVWTMYFGASTAH